MPRKTYRQILLKSLGPLEKEPAPSFTKTGPSEMTIHLRPIGDGLVGHRQGHHVRQQVGTRLSLSPCEVTPEETRLRVEVFDIPDHLVRKDGTLGFGDRLQMTIRDLLAEALGVEILGHFLPFDEDTFLPSPENPGSFFLECYLNEPVFAYLAEKTG